MGKWNVNLQGKKFGRWNVTERVGNVNGYHHWACICDCGIEKTVDGRSLTQGLSTSCGCFKSENTSKLSRKHGQCGKTSEYNIWGNMIQRCTNVSVECYPRYGGRGIKVCDRWLNSFEAFFEDMGPRPSLGHTLDRWPDNDGDYGPLNCRWATIKEQFRNFRGNRWLECNGIRMIMKDWSEKWSIHPSAILGHFKRGKTFDDIYNHFENKKLIACLK